MPKFKVKLTEESIDAALKGVRAYNKKVKAAGPKITKELTEQGALLAKMNAESMRIYDTGQLVSGIEAQYLGGFGAKTAKGYVVSTAPYSAFVEFGTGVRGKNAPHPNITIPGWRYDANNHGEAGWWYTDETGRSRWTAGMASRPYMYNTAQSLVRLVVPIVKETLK